jgi:uncharacterized damage-inducible protein DinB
MSLVNLIREYAAYNAWANEKLVNYLLTKPKELLTITTASSYCSIIRTLGHVLDSQDFWVAVIKQQEFVDRQEEELNNMDAVLNPLIDQSIKMNEFVNSFSEEHLCRKIKTPWIEEEKPVYEVLQHAFNHSTYHRGQVITMGRQLGFEDGVMTDFYEYLKVKSG